MNVYGNWLRASLGGWNAGDHLIFVLWGGVGAGGDGLGPRFEDLLEVAGLVGGVGDELGTVGS